MECQIFKPIQFSEKRSGFFPNIEFLYGLNDIIDEEEKNIILV